MSRDIILFLYLLREDFASSCIYVCVIERDRCHSFLCSAKSKPFSLNPFQIREEIRQDTVCGDKELCLFKKCSLREGEQTSGGSERKSEVTLKTIGLLPGHSAVQHLSFTSLTLILPPSLHMFQDASAACLGADGRDKEWLTVKW